MTLRVNPQGQQLKVQEVHPYNLLGQLRRWGSQKPLTISLHEGDTLVVMVIVAVWAKGNRGAIIYMMLVEDTVKSTNSATLAPAHSARTPGSLGIFLLVTVDEAKSSILNEFHKFFSSLGRQPHGLHFSLTVPTDEEAHCD